MREVDVLIVGGGPAGATAALNLAPIRRVAVVEARAEVAARIGECLPSVAGRLLRDMGLFDAFLLQGHTAWHGNRALWGSSTPIENDFLRDLNGPGWHLDRVRFEQWLRVVAQQRGAAFHLPARVAEAEWMHTHWAICLDTGEELRARLLIDASGRGASLARRMGARMCIHDRLTCRWTTGRGVGTAGLTVIEAVEDGWWYTAPLPHDHRILAFHSDAQTGVSQPISEKAMTTVEVSRILRESDFHPDAGERVSPAFSGALSPCVGAAWLAVGDAALSVDPLASQGLLNALYTGLAAAEAANRHLAGEAGALEGYARTISRIRAKYDRERAHWYQAEDRWPESPFWRARHAAVAQPQYAD